MAGGNGPELVKTGIPGLDDLLHGGFPRGACVVVEGVPGTGKTTLGAQFVYNGIVEHGTPGIIFSFEEFPEEIHRDAASYGWDLRSLEDEGKLRIVCTSPEVFKDDTMTPEGLFDTLVEEMQAERIVVDSITQMAHVTSDPLALRQLVYGLRNCFKRHKLTAILTTELRSSESAEVPSEEYLADVVVRLGYRLLPDVGSRVRELEVTKSRARPHVPGRHLAEITSKGLSLLPRHPKVGVPEVRDGMEFVSIGSAGLDGMLGGGLLAGTTALVAGSTGVGKTVLGLQFLSAGAAAGERGLMVSFEQAPGELARLASSLGMPPEVMSDGGPVSVLYEAPEARPLGYLVAHIAQAVKEIKPKRIVVDAMSTLGKAPVDQNTLRWDLSELISVLRASGATSLVCDETPGIVGEFVVTGGVAISSLLDTIVVMRYVELSSEIRRAVSILKARCVDHDKEIREYVIGPGGIELRDKFKIATGLLRGAPVRSKIEDFF